MNNTINSITGWVDKLDHLFINIGMSSGLTTFVRTFLIAVVIIGLAVLADFIARLADVLVVVAAEAAAGAQLVVGVEVR